MYFRFSQTRLRAANRFVSWKTAENFRLIFHKTKNKASNTKVKLLKLEDFNSWNVVTNSIPKYGDFRRRLYRDQVYNFTHVIHNRPLTHNGSEVKVLFGEFLFKIAERLLYIYLNNACNICRNTHYCVNVVLSTQYIYGILEKLTILFCIFVVSTHANGNNTTRETEKVGFYVLKYSVQSSSTWVK